MPVPAAVMSGTATATAAADATVEEEDDGGAEPTGCWDDAALEEATRGVPCVGDVGVVELSLLDGCITSDSHPGDTCVFVCKTKAKAHPTMYV